jgi:hypothetical protein
MRKDLRQLRGLVVAHRWFRHGADWAFHGDIGSKALKRITERLASELSGRNLSDEWSVFTRSHVLKGLDVVGIQKLDEASPDPKAKDRQPSALIGLLVPSGFIMDNADVVRALEPLVPRDPGPDDRLMVPQVVKKTNESEIKVWLMRALIVAAFVLITVVAICYGNDSIKRREAMYQAMAEVSGEGSGNQESKGLDKIINILRSPASQRQRKWEAFTAKYCTPTNLPSSDHPDIQRLRTLLPYSDRKDDPWRFAEDKLNEWAQHVGLDAKLSNDATSSDIKSYIKDIVKRLKYRPWLEAELRTNSWFRARSFTGSNVVDDVWRKRAIDLCDQQDEIFVNCAKGIYELLKKWNVQEVNENDIKDRPWFLIHAFFAFLNRERFDMPNENEQSAFDRFVLRLPKTNVLAETDYSFTTSDDIVKALRALTESIQGKTLQPQLNCQSALDTIEREMRYLSWYNEKDKKLKVDKKAAFAGNDAQEYLKIDKRLEQLGRLESQSGPINEFVERFRKGARHEEAKTHDSSH